MPVSAKGAVQHFESRLRQANEAAQWFEELSHTATAAQQRIEQQLKEASRTLARAYLPELSGPALLRAERLSGFRGFSRRSPLEAMAHEATVLRKTIERIKADERYLNRERLVGRIGTLTRAVEEAEQMLQPFELECQRFESQEGFLELVQAGYDTPNFNGKWWTGEYWKQWKRGDAICAALGLKDFGDDVLPAYRASAEPRDYWKQTVADKKTKVAEVHQLVAEHDRAVARIPNLPLIYLEQCEQVLADFLTMADFGLLEQWSNKEPSEDRAIAIGLRTVAGLKAKLEIIGDLTKAGIPVVTSSLAERARKYDRKRIKYGRPKQASRRIPDRELDQTFTEKQERLKAQRDKTVLLIERIEAYDRYDRFSLNNDPELWWYEFSGGRPASALLPRYQRWYQRHPNAQPSLDDRVAATQGARAVAAARAADSLEREEYLS